MAQVCMDSFETEIKDFEKFLDSKLAIDYNELPKIPYRKQVGFDTKESMNQVK